MNRIVTAITATLILFPSQIARGAVPVPDKAPASTPNAEDASRQAVMPPSFAHIARRVAPSVVTLLTPDWLGSGFIIDRSGLVVTNAHVVDTREKVQALLSDGTRHPVTVIGMDRATDVALVKIVASRSFPPVSLGSDRHVEVGDWVLAVGSPDGLTGTVTAGIVSAIHRDRFKGARLFTDYLQIDAAVNHGNSGGPTFDMSGRVVGMNAVGSYLTSNCVGKLCERNDGIGFSIPVSTIRMVVEDLRNGPVQRSVVGILVEPVTDEIAKALGLKSVAGALVADVIAGSPAELAGIRSGDVVLKINGATIRDDRDCMRRTGALDAGKRARFLLFRNGQEVPVDAVPVARDSVIDLTPGDDADIAVPAEVPVLGLQFATGTRGADVPYSSGLVVSFVQEGSDASRRGFRPGDRVLRVGARTVKDPKDIQEALADAVRQKREFVLVFVETPTGGRSYVPLRVGD